MRRVLSVYTKYIFAAFATISVKVDAPVFDIGITIKGIQSLLRKFPMACAAVINSILFVIVYQLFAARFETNDDVGMMLLASGTTLSLQPTEYLLFTHIIIGYVLKNLYTFAPAVNWYTFYLIGSLWLAHVALLYVIIQRTPKLIFLLFYGVYFLVCAVYLLVVLQFTMVASMVGIAGMALVFFTNDANPYLQSVPFGRNQWSSLIRAVSLQPSTLIGIALLCFSFLIRYESAALAVLLFIPMLLVDLYANISKRNSLLAKLPICIVGIGLCYGAHSYNNYMYKQYSNYLEFNELRGEFVDYSVAEEVPVAVREAAFAKAGWSENDYTMMMNWFFMNEQLYNIDKFKLVLAELSPKWQGIGFSQLFGSYKYIMGFSIVLGCLVTTLFFLLFLRYSTINMVKIGVAFLTINILILIIHYYLQITPKRVFYPMFIFVCLTPLLVASRITIATSAGLYSKKYLIFLTLLILVVAVIPSLAANRKYTGEAQSKNKWLKEMMTNFHFKPHSLFIEWGGAFPYEGISPFDDPKLMNNFNFLSLTSGQLTPASKAMLAKFNIKDIYLDLATKDDIYLIIPIEENKIVPEDEYDSLIESLNIYMQEHYQKSIKATPVYEFDQYLILNIDGV